MRFNSPIEERDWSRLLALTNTGSVSSERGLLRSTENLARRLVGSENLRAGCPARAPGTRA